MNTAQDFHAEAEQFLARSKMTEIDRTRALLIQLSEAWEVIAQAWEFMPEMPPDESEPVRLN